MGKRLTNFNLDINPPVREKKVPDVEDATDCALRNSETECEGLKEKNCNGCKFWCPEHWYDWDKERQCIKNETT